MKLVCVCGESSLTILCVLYLQNVLVLLQVVGDIIQN